MKQNELRLDASSLKKILRVLSQELVKWGWGAQIGSNYIKLKKQCKPNTDIHMYIEYIRRNTYFVQRSTKNGTQNDSDHFTEVKK